MAIHVQAAMGDLEENASIGADVEIGLGIITSAGKVHTCTYSYAHKCACSYMCI